MSVIDFEDRTIELPDAAVQRQVENASRAIIGAAIMASQGDPSVGMGALILALGQGTARTGLPIEAVVEAVKAAHQEAQEQIARARGRQSDA